MAKNNNVETHKKNTKIENDKRSELKPKETTKKKKLRLHSHLRVNIPLFQSLMMILPSLAKHAEATEGACDSANDKYLTTANSVVDKDIVDTHTNAAPLEATHQNIQKNESQEIPDTTESQAPHGANTHLVPSHHLSTLSHPQVHYIPSVSMPTISAGGNGQPTHSNTPPTPTTPVTFIPEVIKGTYGELHVDVNGQYTFILNPNSPQYILLNQHQQGTDHFALHLSNGASIVVQIPVTGKQDLPSISGDLAGAVTEDHNIDSQGLLHANGKIDVIDPDQNESSVTPEVITGKYGSLTIDADGHWKYQVDNSLSNVQALTGATSLHESFTIHTKDGTPQTIDMTIGGNDDNAVITGVDAGSVVEDLTTQVQGQLSVTDPDLGEDHFQASQVNGHLGTLTIDKDGSWTYDLDNTNPNVQALGQGATATDTVTVHSADGTQHQVTVTINGTNDKAVIGGISSGAVTEESQLKTSGTLTITDVDTGEAHFSNTDVAGALGTLHLKDNGAWTYDLDNTNPTVQALGKGATATDTVTVHSADGTPHQITVTVNGTNDKAVIGGTSSGTVTEESQLQTSGTLMITDVDTGEAHFSNTDVAGALGTLHLKDNGTWTYDLDNTNPKVQALGKGATATDTVTVHSADGTPHQITVTINGTNDRPTISGTSSGAVSEQGLNTAGTPDATGSLTATDLDKSDTVTWAINQPQGQWGTLSIDQNGHWHYQLDNSTGGATDKLAAGEHQSESFWITATDSAGATVPHKIVIDVQGSNDKPIVSAWTQLPAGKEDQPVTIKASDLLTHASDVDSSDVLHVTNLQATHGSLTDNKDGTYTFTPDKDFNGEIRLTYDVVDAHGGSVSTQAKFDLTATPDNAIITDAQTNADLRGVTEDRGYIDTHYQLHYDGKLNIQDPDAGEAQFDPNIGPQTYQGYGYNTKLGGHILLMRDGHYTYTLDNRNIQNLAQGEVKHDSAVIRSADGTTHTIELTVHGTNDAPVINAQSHSVTEDGQLLTGQMQGHDIDHGATLTYSIAQAVDGLTFNPDGSYSFDPSHPSYQSLVQGQTQTLTVPVTVTDEHGASAMQNLEIMVTGSNDGAQISGTDTGDVYESTYTDRSPDYQRGNISHLRNDHIHTSGKLDIVDSDAGEAHFDNNAPAYQYFGQYGRLILQPDGNWYYRVDVGDSAIGRKIDALNTGENLTDTITIRSADGTTHDVVITIHGDNDSPFASSEVQLNSGKEDNAQTITEAQLLANSMDVDTSDAGKLHVDNLQVDHGSIRDNQDGTYTFTPEKDYNGQVHFTYDVKDAHSGVTHTGATMTLAPVGDAATIIGTDTGSITEDRHVFPDSMHHIQVTGSLSVSDPDAGEDHFRESGAFGYEKAISDPFQGEMHIDRYGNWDYVLANGNPALQALKQGETKDVIYEVHSAGGTPHRITITVTGTNDAPTVSSSVTLAAGKEDTAVTLQASDLLAHASDIDHNAQLSIHNLSADHGQIVDNHDGTFRFIPDKDYNGPVQFSYQVQDEHGASVAQTASMNLVAVNDVATISGDSSASVTEGGSQGAMPDLTVAKGACLANIGSGFDFPPVIPNDPNTGRWYAVGGSEGPAGGVAQGLDLKHGFWVMNMGDPNYGVNGYALFTRNTNSATAHFNGVTDDAHGDLHISDPDATPDTFVNVQNQMGDHGYGTFTMKDGHWSFTAGDKATSLPDGAKAQETFTFRTHDGVTHQVTINLTGTDTPSEFKGDFSGNLREGNVGDNAAVHGSISITDPDTNQTPTLPDMPSTSGDNGYGSFTMHNGHWEYTLDQSKVQHVGAKETVQDKITVTASDGTKHDIVVTIQGTNDAPVVNGQTFITPQNGNTPIALSDLLANVRDPDTHDNQHLSVSHLQADHGTITPDGHGGYLYHPENGYKGPVDISYQVTDPEGASVSVHASMGSAPTASSGIIQMHEDSPHTFTAAEFSADNFDQLTISSLPDVTHGTLTFNGQPVAAGQHIDTAHIDQLVFTPAQNYHGDASFGFTVSENGMQSAAASGHIMVDSVTDAASISMHLSATESTMQTGQGNGLAVTRLDGSHLTHQTSPELTAEVVVKIPSGSHLNKESVLIQFGNAVAKGEQQGAAAVCKIYSDDSHTNTLNTFTVTNPQNLTIWLPGHKPIQTGIDITQNHDPHRLTFSVNTASHSATVYQDGQPVFHTNSAQIWHDSDLGMNSYNTAGDDAQIFGNPTFWFNHQGRGGDHIPIFIAKAVGHTGVNLGDGLHPLMNENGQVMYSDGQMKAPASDLSVQAVFTSAVIMQGEVTAQQVASGPLSESTPGIGSGRVLLELGIQGGQLVDHTGHQSNALEHHSLNCPLIGGDPLHHELNLDVQATDPDDHVSSVKLTGLPDGTILDDGHGHSATVQNGQAIDVQDWNRASIGVVLPNTAPTGDVHLHVEVTTTGPDGATATSTADNTSMHVSDVMTDTAPDIIQSIMLGDEDQTYHFSEQDFGYSDKDGDPLDHVTITQLPDPAHGQLLINGHAVTAGQEISVYDIGKLLFQPAKDFNGDVDFQYSVSDGLKYSAPSQGTLTIAPVVDVTIKLSPASDLGSSNTDNLTNDATPTITGYTDIPYSQVTIYDGSKPVGHAVSDASGQYSVVVNSLTDGNHNLSAKASTPSSGISATSSFLSVHIDTQVHVGIQMDPITADSVINAQESNSSINITGAVSGDFSIGDIVTLDVNGAQHTGTVDAKGHYSIAVPGSELIADADQQIEASIMVTDSAGNSVHAVTNGAYQVDTQVNLPTITFENPGPDGLYSKAEIAQGHPNTITATITPPSDAKVGEHLVVNGQDHLLDAHTLQHGIQIEVHPGSNVQATMTDEHGNTAGSQGVAASAIPEPIVVKPPSGSHQVSGTLGVPPLVPSQTPVPSAQNGWRIHLPNGQYVTSHHGQYGTLTIDPQTGDLHYQEQAQVHTGPHGSASGIGQHEDRFEIALQGTNQDEVVAHVNIQILSHGPGHSGKLTVGTEVVDMTITPIVHASHPAPPPVQHDEPEIASHEDFTFTVSEDTSLDLSQHAHQEPDQKTDHHGAAAYLDALGIQPNASPSTTHDQPADMDIVLAQVDQQHAADYDQTHLDMSDALEHHDAANNHNQDDEHHHHNDVDGLPDIDPNN